MRLTVAERCVPLNGSKAFMDQRYPSGLEVRGHSSKHGYL